MGTADPFHPFSSSPFQGHFFFRPALSSKPAAEGKPLASLLEDPAISLSFQARVLFKGGTAEFTTGCLSEMHSRVSETLPGLTLTGIFLQLIWWPTDSVACFLPNKMAGRINSGLLLRPRSSSL